jgi:hypothetical protein
MSRFLSVSEAKNINTINQIVETKNYPFKNLYGCVEADMVYVNMEAIESLVKGMVTLRDIGIIIDISGSMKPYFKDRSVELLCKQIVDTLASFDDDGVDLLFFGKGLVYKTTVKNAGEVSTAINNAINSKGAYSSTMPTGAFREFCNQLKQKGRAGTVLYLTDGGMDDKGAELLRFYKDVLHEQFKTRDNFYCYAIEFGKGAKGALDVLDGLYKPDQGPEDLFDLDSAENLEKIGDVLSQVGGMSAIGSDVMLTASVDNGKIDMVNSDLIEGGMQSIQGPINKMMSFRVRTKSPFHLKLQINGFQSMTVRVTPNGFNADIEII